MAAIGNGSFAAIVFSFSATTTRHTYMSSRVARSFAVVHESRAGVRATVFGKTDRRHTFARNHTDRHADEAYMLITLHQGP